MRRSAVRRAHRAIARNLVAGVNGAWRPECQAESSEGARLLEPALELAQAGHDLGAVLRGLHPGWKSRNEAGIGPAMRTPPPLSQGGSKEPPHIGKVLLIRCEDDSVPAGHLQPIKQVEIAIHAKAAARARNCARIPALDVSTR